jgi:hypothetical protein
MIEGENKPPTQQVYMLGLTRIQLLIAMRAVHMAKSRLSMSREELKAQGEVESVLMRLHNQACDNELGRTDGKETEEGSVQEEV